MNYRAALQIIYSRWNAPALVEQRRRLRRMPLILQQLGSPHERFHIVHIAGTKGKGSVAAAIAAVLSTRYVVGLYTSPHLHTFRERIRIGSELIQPQTFADLVTDIVLSLPRADRADSEPVTGFEILTAAAFLHFARSGVQWAVIEVGMGGRVDPTNVVTPDISVITEISHDHTHYLGKTIFAIAKAKAGIIKAQVPVVASPQLTEAEEVLRRTSQRRSSPLYLWGRDWSWTGTRYNLTVNAPYNRYPRLTVPLLGLHQVENFAVATTALDVLRARGCLRLTYGDIKRGLASVEWPGRLEVLRRRPLIVVDGAHNGRSAERLCQALSAEFRYRHLYLVIGIGEDKDIRAILSKFAPRTHFAAVTRSDHASAACPTMVASELARLGTLCKTFQTLRAAIKAVSRRAASDDLICITGSLHLVAEARRVLGAPGSNECDTK
jgi:dihydrofolate synthase/folylpolyglutamate synthase